MYLACEVESLPTRFPEIPRAVNTGSTTSSQQSRGVRMLLPENEQLTCLQSNYRTRLCFQKLPQPAGLTDHLAHCTEAALPSRSSGVASWHAASGRDLKHQGNVALTAWRYPLITVNFVSSSRVADLETRLFALEKPSFLEMIMKRLKMFCLMLFGCIDLGRSPGRPHTSLRR